MQSDLGLSRMLFHILAGTDFNFLPSTSSIGVWPFGWYVALYVGLFELF